MPASKPDVSQRETVRYDSKHIVKEHRASIRA